MSPAPFPSTPFHPRTVAVPRRDTRAWKAQVWISFCLAVSVCGIGLAWLPGHDLDRAFMVMGYFFSLSSAFVLAKFVRDREAAAGGASTPDTPMWKFVVWSAFALAMLLTLWGLLRMHVDPVYKSFLAVSWLFLISSVFTLAKMLRDAHEAALSEADAHRRQDDAATGPAAH